MTIDYESLLRRYIEHVSALEGEVYLGDRKRAMSDVVFTDVEWYELKHLAGIAAHALPRK